MDEWNTGISKILYILFKVLSDGGLLALLGIGTCLYNQHTSLFYSEYISNIERLQQTYLHDAQGLVKQGSREKAQKQLQKKKIIELEVNISYGPIYCYSVIYFQSYALYFILPLPL